MAQWEYKIIVADRSRAEFELNELAAEGWEPVNLSATSGVALSCFAGRKGKARGQQRGC